MRLWLIGGLLAIMLLSASIFAKITGSKPENLRRATIKTICLNPIGLVKKSGDRAFLEIFPEYAPALEGLKGFSHVWVFYWFHENDTLKQRQTLRVYPRRDPNNPLTGVFACRSPERPNLIGFTACRLVNVNGNIVEVASLDARDGVAETFQASDGLTMHQLFGKPGGS
jgi:tRNA-Thr(GGU) m(6)t(6)A37 methyltransferase TsaA